MRIWHIVPAFPPQHHGGIVTYVAELTHHLASIGICVEVLVPRNLGDNRPTERSRLDSGLLLNVVRAPASQRGETGDFNLTEHLDRNQALSAWAEHLCSATGAPDLVHVHDWFVGPAALDICRKLACPLVNTLHYCKAAELPTGRNLKQQYVVRMQGEISRAADLTIVLSEAMANEVSSIYGVPPQDIAVIPPGLDSPHKTIPLRLGDHPTIVFAGRLSPEKGLQYLIDAMPSVVRAYPDIQLLAAGEGLMEEDLRAQAKRLRVADNIRFLGFVDRANLWPFYDAADVMVVPSTYEPFGMVALEAMASGAALVASRVGGLAEIVEDGVTGLLVPPHDSAAIGAAIIRLLSDKSLRDGFASAGFRRLHSLYRWDNSAAAVEKLYRQILQPPVIVAQARSPVND